MSTLTIIALVITISVALLALRDYCRGRA